MTRPNQNHNDILHNIRNIQWRTLRGAQINRIENLIRLLYLNAINDTDIQSLRSLLYQENLSILDILQRRG